MRPTRNAVATHRNAKLTTKCPKNAELAAAVAPASSTFAARTLLNNKNSMNVHERRSRSNVKYAIQAFSSDVMPNRLNWGAASTYAGHSIRKHDGSLLSRHRARSLVIANCVRPALQRGHSVQRPPAKSQIMTPTTAISRKQMPSLAHTRSSAMRQYCTTFARTSIVSATGPRTMSTFPRPRHRGHAELGELVSISGNSTGQ